MRQSVMTMLVMFLGLSIGVAPGVAQEAEQTLMDEVKAVLTQHDQAFSEKNLSGVLETYGSDEKIILMGIGPAERWVGKAEIEQAYTNFF